MAAHVQKLCILHEDSQGNPGDLGDPFHKQLETIPPLLQKVCHEKQALGETCIQLGPVKDLSGQSFREFTEALQGDVKLGQEASCRPVREDAVLCHEPEHPVENQPKMGGQDHHAHEAFPAEDRPGDSHVAVPKIP